MAGYYDDSFDDSRDGDWPVNEYTEAIASMRQVECRPEAEQCKCHGCGWWLTDFDSYDKCPYHWTPDKQCPEL